MTNILHVKGKRKWFFWVDGSVSFCFPVCVKAIPSYSLCTIISLLLLLLLLLFFIIHWRFSLFLYFIPSFSNTYTQSHYYYFYYPDKVRACVRVCVGLRKKINMKYHIAYDNALNTCTESSRIPSSTYCIRTHPLNYYWSLCQGLNAHILMHDYGCLYVCARLRVYKC
jgi:hypothetical protein